MYAKAKYRAEALPASPYPRTPQLRRSAEVPQGVPIVVIGAKDKNYSAYIGERRRPFTPRDVEMLKEMYMAGSTDVQIAEALGRTKKIIWQKRKALMERGELISRKKASAG